MSEVRTARDRLDRIGSMLVRATRFWVPSAIVIVVGTVCSLAFAFTRHRVYKSETLMLYKEGIRSADLGGNEGGGADPARKLGMKLKEMVLSRMRLQPIISEYKLYPEITADRSIEDAVEEMRNHISFRTKDGDTFGLSFEGEDPKNVQSVTARLAEALIVENSKHRTEQAEATKDFLDSEKKRTEEELRDKEGELAKFLAKHPEFAKESQNSGGAATALRAAQQQKGTKNSDPTLLALEREAARIQERLGMPITRRPSKKEEAQADPKLVAAKNEAESDLHQAQRELADKLAQFTEQHPDVRGAKAKVKSAQDKLKRATEAITADAATQQKPEAPPDEGTIDRATLESQLQKVTEEIAAHKNKKRRENESEPKDPSNGAAWIVALETEWSQLNRDVQEARGRTTQLQDKQFKASMVENAVSRGSNAQMVIVDPAFRPTHPIRPSRSLLALVGLLISIVLAFALALGCALIDDRLYDRIDLERLELAPLLGVVPRAEAKRG